jgi:hypothetical protein
VSFFKPKDFTCACSALDSSENCLAVNAADRANAKRDAELERLRAENAELFERWQAKFPELVSVKKERDELRADNARLRDALEFYAGKPGESEWDGCKFLTFDKFGGLDEDAAGPAVAHAALADADHRV